MLSGRWVEAQRNSVNLDLQQDLLLALITFCFTDKLPDNFDLVGKLLVISDRLFINSLRLRCENYLARHLNAEKCAKNALKLFSFSLQTTAQVLASKCVQIIKKDLTVLLETGYLGKFFSNI